MSDHTFTPLKTGIMYLFLDLISFLWCLLERLLRNKRQELAVFPVSRTDLLGFFHQCSLWKVTPHHWSSSVFGLLFVSKQLLPCHWHSILASQALRSTPTVFYYVPFHVFSLLLQVLQIWKSIFTWFIITIYIRFIIFIRLFGRNF